MDLHVISLRYSFIWANAFSVASFVNFSTLQSFMSGDKVISTSMLTATGLLPSVSLTMFRSESFRRGTLEYTCSRAAFSAISHSFASCSGVNSGMPISSKKGVSPKSRTQRTLVKLGLGHVATSFVILWLGF